MDAQDLQRRFTYHPPKDDQPDRYQLIRDHAPGRGRVLDERGHREE